LLSNNEQPGERAHPEKEIGRRGWRGA